MMGYIDIIHIRMDASVKLKSTPKINGLGLCI